MILLSELSKSFDGGARRAVRDVSLEVGDGETLVLLGASGCGKTTTLKMINRLIEPSAGRIEVDGVDVRERDVLDLRRSIGYVFQDIGLFPHLTACENVEIVPRLLGWPVEKRRERSTELFQLVGLDAEEFGERLPRHLSGGQQQRIAIARALAADPGHLLMDEPFGALDAVTRDQLQRQLIDLRAALSKTIVFVTHDLFEAIRLADRIGVMNGGRLEQIGTASDLMERPATPFVAELLDQARRQAALVGEVR